MDQAKRFTSKLADLFLFKHQASALILLAITFWWAPVRADLTTADYAALPRVQMMSISPAGDRIAFRRRSDDQDLLLVISLADGKLLQGLDVGDIRPQHLYFLNQNKIILVVTDENRRLRGFRGTHDVSTAFIVNVDSGEIEQLLRPGDVIFRGQTGLGRVWGQSTDGQRVFMPAFVARDRRSQSPDYSLLEVDLTSVRRPRVVHRGSPHTIRYFLNAQSQVIAEETFNSRRGVHAVIAHREDGSETIFEYDADYPHAGFHGLTPDHEHLIFTSLDAGSDRHAYFQLSLTDGTVKGPLFERQQTDVYQVLTDINQIVYGVVYAGFRPEYHFFDEALNARFKEIQAHFPQQATWLSDISPDYQHVIVSISGNGMSGEYYLFSGNQPPSRLAMQRPNISNEHVHPVITYSYEARDGLIIPTLLTFPQSAGDTLENLPAVLLPHGGPWVHDFIGFDWLAQALANEGYVVIQPQFRGSTGFGAQHFLAGRGEWGKKMQDDLTDALKSLIEANIVDPGRVCIVGASYGGYAALMAGALTPDLYQCIISINGISDIRGLLSDERSTYGRHHQVISYIEDIISEGDTRRRTLATISPIRHSDAYNAPVLLVHGDNDRVVNYNQSSRMYRQLRRARKPVELVRLRGEDHYLSQAQTRLDSLNAITEFLRTHIGTPDS